MLQGDRGFPSDISITALKRINECLKARIWAIHTTTPDGHITHAFDCIQHIQSPSTRCRHSSWWGGRYHRASRNCVMQKALVVVRHDTTSAL